MELYLTFSNTHAVILAEKILLAAGIEVKVRPVPADIKAGCGLALAIGPNLKQKAHSELCKNSLAPEASYIKEKNKFTLADD